MIISDKQVGSNLQRLRASLSQRELARRLRERGLNWTHLTVAAVERGERPLRVVEAIEIAHELSQEPEMLFLEEQVVEYQRVTEEARAALDGFYASLDTMNSMLEKVVLTSMSATEDANRGIGGSSLTYLELRLRSLRRALEEVLADNERWVTDDSLGRLRETTSWMESEAHGEHQAEG